MKLFSHLSALFGLSALTLLLADVAPVGLDPSIATLIGNGCTVAVLAWYVVYDVRVRTPLMLTAFQKEQEEMRATFAREQEEMRKANWQVVDSIRLTFQQEQNSSRQVFVAEQTAQRETYQREMGETRQMLFETMKSMRTAVHDVKDTAQTLMSGK
jgi:hypothetical protein